MLRPLSLLLFGLALGGCAKEPDLVLYCALDRVFAEDLVREFEAETGLTVQARYDLEQHKTIGLVQAIREEASFTRCDVFWNNEVANSVALANEGLLEPYDSPSAAEIPALFRDPENHWTGFAARARIFIVNTDLVPEGGPTHTLDLVSPEWRGQVGMARPLTGTTLTHAAALYQVLGEAQAKDYIEQIIGTGVSLTSGNATLMRQVREGSLSFGWTDTDDFNVAREAGYPVRAVYPDQDGMGTFVIPNTICLVKNAPHPDNGRRFIDWALRPEIEARLAAGRSAQIPVRDSVERPDHVQSPGDFKPMEVDYRALGKELPQRFSELKERFLE